MLAGTFSIMAAIGMMPVDILHEAPSQVPEVQAFGGVTLALDRSALGRVAIGGSCVTEIPIGDGASLPLELTRFDAFTDDAQVVVASVRDGRVIERESPRPYVALLRGNVVDDPSTRAFLAIGETGINGLIESGSERWVIAQPRDGRWTAVYDVNAVDPEDMRWIESVCGTSSVQAHAPAPTDATSRGIVPDCPPRLRMAIETDWQFTNLFGGDTAASGEYAATLIGAVSSIYYADLEVGVQICYLRLWESASDPWSGGDSGAQLNEFGSYWNSQMDHVERHLAHMLSGQGLGGGIAYVGVVCTNSGYAVSGNLGGSFPLPIEDHHGNNWDLMVVAHETGHNCGTGHTHDYNPPIDGCGDGDCSAAWGGTIMSYCHLCSGGLSNMVMEFHPTVQATIENYIAGLSCDLGGDGAPPVANVDDVTVVFGDSIDIDVLLNDYTNDCSDPVILDHDVASPSGGAVELIGGETGVLRYTPSASQPELDSFFYTMGDASGQDDRVGVLVRAILPRPADSPTSVAAGTRVRYYDLDNPSVLPDFDTLTPMSEEVVANVDFASTNGNFAGSGLSDDVGAVFEGLIDVPASGTYTLYVESDDGSKLFIGDELVVDNDGLHPMNEEGGQILLAAGLHRTRVEFFERGGGAGVIVRIEGGGLTKQVVDADQWWHDVSTPGDATGDGVANIEDILAVIDAFGQCDGPCLADLDDDGDVDVDDLLIVVSNFQVG